MVGLYDFQEKAVDFLLEKCVDETSERTLVIKAPTGAGKTVILLDFIDKYLKNNPKTAFIWLTPGGGELEEQSMKRMESDYPHRRTSSLIDSLTTGFEEQTTTFVNWELVTKRDNKALKDTERQNLFTQIRNAYLRGIQFIVIIDEEHQNNTGNASVIVDAFAAHRVVRVSATTVTNKNHCEYHEVDELAVIDKELITKGIYVNEGFGGRIEVTDDSLLDAANKKRLEIQKAYADLGLKINPLVLVQFPNGEPEKVRTVEKQLELLNCTYDNGLVAKWLSDEKINVDSNLVANNSDVAFLLMKQAINVGWDCPRAKILVKLRENGNDTFVVQTVGRIRRMPERKFYTTEVLNNCFVYTFDKDYKSQLLRGMDRAYEPKRLFLKDKCKSFTLQKELKNLDMDYISEKELYDKIKKFFITKYQLTNDKEHNKQMLKELGGYKFESEILGEMLIAYFVKSDSMADNNEQNIQDRREPVDLQKHNAYLYSVINDIKIILGSSHTLVRGIVEKLFSKRSKDSTKILSLGKDDFYAFIINNASELRNDMRELASGTDEQLQIPDNARRVTFSIPTEDFFKYDYSAKDEQLFETNAYEGYTTGFVASAAKKSQPEILFEQYCEEHKDVVDWIYKNGDGGLQYFCIRYMTAVDQRLFYPDYIVQMNSGDVWIIETKGGESQGKDKNIDKFAKNKFEALKLYCKEFNLKWAFVRDKDGSLYYNNTEYTEDLGDKWLSIKGII